MKGFKKEYQPVSSDGLSGNYIKSSSSSKIVSLLKLVNTKRPEIKNIIIDDYQYIMAFEFFEKAEEKGYDKYASIGKNGAKPLMISTNLREDLKIFVLKHKLSELINIKDYLLIEIYIRNLEKILYFYASCFEKINIHIPCSKNSFCCFIMKVRDII